MKSLKINLMDGGGHDLKKRRRFSFWKGLLVAIAAMVIVLPVFFSVTSVKLIRAVAALNPIKQKEDVSFFEHVRRLVGNSERELRGAERGRVNILVMGEGGVGHDGAHLTDTILFASLEPASGRLAIMSLPRDLWVPYPDGTRFKLNHANAIAENEESGSGGKFAADIVANLLDEPVDYYARVDFSAFKTLIDDVGGVTVNVEREFTDYAYPTDHSLYKTVRFEKGWQTMNGNTALEFSRSRHGNNNEGSDFARSHRQQKVMVALKDKIVSFDTLLNPSRVASIMETLRSHVITDLELWEIVKLAKMARNVKTKELTHHVLDDSPGGPLYASTVPVSNGDAYVLLPRREDWSDLRRLADDIFTARMANGEPVARAPFKVEIKNGTRRPGLAQKTRDLLDKIGYEIVAIGNAREQAYEKTVVYDLTDGREPEALYKLKGLLNAEVSLSLPGFLASGVTPSEISISSDKDGKADFLVVVGENYTF
jgi:LCP family protein required for cell wall assembly